MIVSRRLTRWVEAAYGADAPAVLDILRELPEHAYGNQSSERIHAALVSDPAHLKHRLAVLLMDWRDTLMAAGLGDDDWRERLDAMLGRP